jgi:hypothetical protein
MLGVAGQQRIGAVGQGNQFIAGINTIIRIEVRVIVATQARLDRLGQFARDDDFWLRTHDRILQ